MILVSGHSLGLRVESLMKETACLLGFKRIGSRMRAVLTEAFESLIKEGMLIRRDRYVIRAERS